MDNTTSVTLRISASAMLARLNSEADNLSFMVQTEKDAILQGQYYGAMLHVIAAAQIIKKSQKES